MTRIVPKNSIVPDYAGTPTKPGEGSAISLPWQMLVTAPGQALPNPDPDPDPAAADLHIPRPASTAMQQPAMPFSVGEVFQQASVSMQAGVPHQHSGQDALSMLEKLEPMEAEERGFAYPQKLVAGSYLSQLQEDVARVGSTQTSVGIRQYIPIDVNGHQAGPVSAGAGLYVSEPPAGPVSIVTDARPGAGTATPVHMVTEQEASAEAEQPAQGAFDPHEWLKHNRTVLERQGHLQVWIRDYMLDERTRGALVQTLVLDARATGCKVASITLNGNTVWKDGDPI